MKRSKELFFSWTVEAFRPADQNFRSGKYNFLNISEPLCGPTASHSLAHEHNIELGFLLINTPR